MADYQLFLAFLVGVLVGTSLVFLTQEDDDDLLAVAEQRVRLQDRLQARRPDRAA